MSEQIKQDVSETNRGEAEERSGAPLTPDENNAPASPSSLPGGDSQVRGAAEEAADAPRTEPDSE
jgi:hypothetical protein